jgi:hypothetical protein
MLLHNWGGYGGMMVLYADKKGAVGIMRDHPWFYADWQPVCWFSSIKKK